MHHECIKFTVLEMELTVKRHVEKFKCFFIHLVPAQVHSQGTARLLLLLRFSIYDNDVYLTIHLT